MKRILTGIVFLFTSLSAMSVTMPSSNMGGIYYSDECNNPISLYLTNGVYEVLIPLGHYINHPDTRSELRNGIEDLRDEGQIINVVVEGGLCL